MLSKIKGPVYSLLFILLSLIYLIIELSFNARILDASASLSTAVDFGQLEIYGRTISASGATLFAWRLLLPVWSTSGLLRLSLKFLFIAVLVFPLVFVGQKKLVDNLVDYSSSETRRSAEILTLLKFGVANGFVEIEELAVDELLLQTAEGKMFITLSGLLAYNSKNMRIVLERELDKIAGYAISTQQSAASSALFKNYLYVSRKILDRYQEYQQAVFELERKQSAATAEAVVLYENAMNQAVPVWQRYQELLEQDSESARTALSQSSTLQYLLMTGQQRANNCSSEECFEDSYQQLETRLEQQLEFFSPLNIWCVESEEAVPKLNCVKDIALINQKIMTARKLKWAVQAGLTRVYSSRLEFLQSNDLTRSVHASLQQQGLQINSDWSFSQYQQMLEDIRLQLEMRYLQDYQARVSEMFKTELMPRLGIAEFSQIETMQIYFAQAFGEHFHQPIALDLSQTEFSQRYIEPLYLARYDALLNKLKADEKWYERDAPYEQSGKASLRNLVVPAVAIMFSLIFGLLNLVNLILNLIFLLVEEKRWLRFAGLSIMSVLILLMPLRHEYQIYSQPAYLDLLSETENNYGLWVQALDWLAKTEPLIYPLGNVLRIQLLNGFSFD